MADQNTLTFDAPVELTAAAEEGKKPTFNIVAYTGVSMNAGGFNVPVIVELSGVKTANAHIPILLDHDPSQIVGQGEATVDSATIRVAGSVMGDSAESQKVVALAKDGFKWQASIGASVVRREFLDAGKKAQVNGREVTGPMVIARESMLQEVSFVAIGADQSTSAAVAASHNANAKGVSAMNFDQWLQAKGWDPASLSADQKILLQGSYDNEIGNHKVKQPAKLQEVFASVEADVNRESQISGITAEFLARAPRRDREFVDKVKTLAELAISASWTAERYELELLRAGRPDSLIFKPSLQNQKVNNRVLEAAVCMTGRLANHEKMFDDQTLQAAHDEFRQGISLNQLFHICASANGYHDRGYSKAISLDCHRAAFGLGRDIQAGYSALNIATILSTTANKFLMEGWNAIDMTPMRIANIRPVSDLKTITTVSLTGDLQYEELGTGGEIKHGKLNELSYTNQAKTYAKMLAITEDDIINDDLGALTSVPRRLGRGAGLKLNDLFWTEFLALVGANFFGSANSNINTGVADMTIGGLAATETIFMAQTDPDGKPLGVMPKIIVVPTALNPAARTLMTSERLITGNTTTQGDGNIWRDRFRVETSPYISNSSYTGYTAAGWWMLADPMEAPVIEIAAYQGRVEPTVESAQADFNTLGVQFRGVCRVGVKRQEYRGGVYADGGAS